MATVDEVHDLLNAVNTVTLKRMEDKTDAINQVTLKRMEEKTDAITDVSLKRIEEKADRATGAAREFQNQTRVQLAEIDDKLQTIIRTLNALSMPGSPTPTPS